MFSQVTLMGRLGADPDFRYVGKDKSTPVCNLSLAVDRPGADKNDPPDWWKITLWNQQADFAANYLAKGGRVMVIGTPALEEWDDDDGNYHAKLVCTAKVIQAIDWAEREEEPKKGKAKGRQTDADKRREFNERAGRQGNRG